MFYNFSLALHDSGLQSVRLRDCSVLSVTFLGKSFSGASLEAS